MNMYKSAIATLLQSITTRHIVIGQNAGQRPSEYNIVEYVRGAELTRIALYTGTLEQCLEYAIYLVIDLNSVPHCLEAKRIMNCLLSECESLAMQDITLYMISFVDDKLRELDDMIVRGGNKWAEMRVRVWDTGTGAYIPAGVHYADIHALINALADIPTWKLDVTGVHGDNGIGGAL